MSIIITYYRHIYYHIFAFISITNLLYFLIQVYFFEEGKNIGIITQMKELPLMYLLNNASVYCQQTQHSLLVSGLLSVHHCNWRRKAGVLLLGDNSESNTSALCVALHTLYHLVWSYLLGYGFHSIFVILFLIYYSYLVLIPFSLPFFLQQVIDFISQIQSHYRLWGLVQRQSFFCSLVKWKAACRWARVWHCRLSMHKLYHSELWSCSNWNS